MNSRKLLKIKTKSKEGDGDDDEQRRPVSPSAEYFNSKALSVCILAIMEFEHPILPDRFLPLVQLLFLPINPRFSSIMVTDKRGVRRWQRVEVNILDHFKVHSYPESLTIQEYDVHHDELLTKIGIEPLPVDQPLWEIHIFKYPTANAAGTLIFKIHHSLGDGYSLVGALLSCLERADDPSLPLTFPSTRGVPKATNSTGGERGISFTKHVTEMIWSAYNNVCDFGWSIAKMGWVVDDETPIRSGSQGVRFHPPVKISSIDFSLDMIKQIKTKQDVTINAVLLGMIFLGARLYMEEGEGEGEEGFRDSKSTIVVVLNTRNINGYMPNRDMLMSDYKHWGNKIAFLYMALPQLTNHNYTNPLHFVSEAHKMIMIKKNSPAVSFTDYFLQFVRRFRGSEVAAEYVESALKNSSMAFTSLIGPVEKMALINNPVKSVFFMPTGDHLSLTVSAMSYMRNLRIGIGAELGFIDSLKFKSCTERAFQLIYDAAMSPSL